MADDLNVTPGVGATVAADDVGGKLHQRVKISVGADGAATDMVGGPGTASAATPRTVTASDSPEVTLLGTIDADTGTISTNTATMVTSLSVLDDWDETDRAKVNPIVGQAGVAAGAGVVGATVQRVTLAIDDPGVVSLAALNYVEDAAAAANPVGGVTMLVRKDTLSSEVTTDGDNVAQRGTAKGEAYTKDVDLLTAITATNTQLNWGFSVAVAPTVTNGAYAAGDIVGALLDFSNCARANDETFIITNVIVALKAAVTSTLSLVLFKADPTSTTKTDNAAYSLNAADAFKVIDHLTGFTLADHGTPNTYSLRNLSLACKPVSGARNIYGLLIDGTGFTLTSTSDLQVTINGVGA